MNKCNNCGNIADDGNQLSCPNCGAVMCSTCAKRTKAICPYCYSNLEFMG